MSRWSWVAIGAVVGVAIGFTRASVSDDIEGIDRVSKADFEQQVLQKDKDGNAIIKNIVVHPPQFSEATNNSVNLVRFKRMAQDKEGKIWWLDKCLIAEAPYKPALPGRVVESANLTIDTYLYELGKQNADLKFNYGWWYVPRNAMILGAIGGIVVIGGVWPSMLSLMIGAGLGGERKPKEARGKPLWAYKSSKPAPVAAAGISANQHQEMQDVTDAYSQGLQGGGGGGTAVAEQTKAAPAEVRKMDGGPLEKAAPLATGPEDDIEVKGEFYPVLIHHKKKADEEHHEK